MSYAMLILDDGPALPVLSCRGTLPLRGAWYWTVELDCLASEEPAVGARATLTMPDRGWRGYVARSREWQGRTRIFFEAGAGGMRADLLPQQYDSALLSTLVRQFVEEAGELLSATSATSTTVIERYHRAASKAGSALSTLLPAGYNWRFLDQGSVWWGEETWLDASEAGILEIEPFGDRATSELAPERPTLSPGQRWAGRKVERVVYSLSEDSDLSAVLHFARDGVEDMRGAFRAAVRAQVPELPHLPRWPAEVVSQAGDGRLELRPDAGGVVAGSPPVAPLYGLPGVRCEVPQGARVGLRHDGGDPRAPRAEGWEPETPASRIEITADIIAINGGNRGVMRSGDTACYLLWEPTTMTLYVAPSLLDPYVPVSPNPNSPNPPPTGTVGTPVLLGVGSERTLAG